MGGKAAVKDYDIESITSARRDAEEKRQQEKMAAERLEEEKKSAEPEDDDSGARERSDSAVDRLEDWRAGRLEETKEWIKNETATEGQKRAAKWAAEAAARRSGNR